MYSCKYGIPVLVEGRLCKQIYKRKNGSTYQLLQSKANITYPTDRLKTWNELSDKQKYSFILNDYETELAAIDFEIAKDPTLRELKRKWKKAALEKKTEALEKHGLADFSFHNERMV